MKNIDMRVEENILKIEIDLEDDQGLSKSGKTTVIGTTEGNQAITGHSLPYDIMLGVNCYHYSGKK